MKLYSVMNGALVFCALFLSCIRNEAPNSEADILSCTVPGDILRREPIIENDKITLMVVPTANLLAQAPEFTLTPGATISPPSGTTRDFTYPQVYTVTSEDQLWKKDYEVTFVAEGVRAKYGFENVKLKEASSYSYDIFYETDANGKWVMDWASGNSGYAMSGLGTTPETFPTSQYEAGIIGKCAKLETKSTGNFGAGIGMPIAAGNIFMGTFNTVMAVIKPLEATKFGIPFDHIPTYLKGYYKYKASDVFTDKAMNVLPDRRDKWDVYAIFYETSDTLTSLNGANRFSSPAIISLARLDDEQRRETDEWTMFYIPFKFKEGKTIDPDKLAAGKYNLAIVCTSSIDGDYFEGAVGSTLLIDELELIYYTENE